MTPYFVFISIVSILYKVGVPFGFGMLAAWIIWVRPLRKKLSVATETLHEIHHEFAEGRWEQV